MKIGPQQRVGEGEEGMICELEVLNLMCSTSATMSKSTLETSRMDRAATEEGGVPSKKIWGSLQVPSQSPVGSGK